MNISTEATNLTSTSPPEIRGAFQNARMIYAMLRVRDLDRAIAFYTDALGMKLFKQRDYPEGQFTLAFVGYGDEDSAAVIELTHNWDNRDYQHGTAFGHIAIGVPDVYAACATLETAGAKIIRLPGPMKADPDEIIAFIEDTDGYRIELVQVERRSNLKANQPGAK